MKARRGIGYWVGVYGALALVSAGILFPIYWMVISSLQGSRLPAIRLFLPLESVTLEAYREVFATMPFLTWYKNSMVVSVITTILAVLVATLGAFALSRYRFRGKRLFSTSILATQLLPGVLLALPMYVLLSRLHLLNSYPGLIMTYLTKALPFSLWMLWGYFNSIPVELEEASLVDGLSRTSSIFRITLPLAAPGLAAVALFAFVLAWEEFLYALLIMGNDSMITLTVGASRLVGNQSIEWGELMAYSVMMTLPTALVFIFVQKYLVQGLTAGAVKA